MPKSLTTLTVVFAAAVAVPARAAVTPSAPAPQAKASGLLVPQASLRGVRVGMSYAQVRAKLGKPRQDRPTAHPILGKTRTLVYGRMTVTIDGRADTSLVTALLTVSRRDRTSSGLGVGSSEAQLRAGLKGLKCETRYGYRTCRLGILRAGHLVTDFSISRAGKAKRISLARVLD